jgi:hypothetical protein
MELGRSLVKKAFRAKKIPSPRCGGGSGWGGESNAVIAFSECLLPLTPPARGGETETLARQSFG